METEIIQQVSGKAGGNICLCKKYKTELMKAFDEFSLDRCNKYKMSKKIQQAPELKDYPIPQKVLNYAECHPKKQNCIACCQIFLYLFESVHGEEISEVFLKERYILCYPSKNKQ